MDRSLDQTSQLLHHSIEEQLNLSIKNYLRGITDTHLGFLEDINDRISLGQLSLEEAQRIASQRLISQSIGFDGYSYAMLPDGLIVAHPQQELLYTQSIFTSEIQGQDPTEGSFIHYQYQGRDKVLYRGFFSEWNWLVASTAYREDFLYLLDMPALEESFHNALPGGDSFLVDIQGNYIIHRESSPQNLEELLFQRIYSQLDRRNNASQVLEWQETQGTYRIFFRYFEDFEWIIGTMFPLDGYDKTIRTTAMIEAGIGSSFLLFILIILGVILRRISKPISVLTQKMLQDKSIELDDLSYMGDEVNLLEQVFDLYHAQIEEDKEELARAYGENELLARFPNELQFPLLRIEKSGEISFMNLAALSMKSQLYQRGTTHLRWDMLQAIQTAKEGMEFKINERIYKLVDTPLKGSEDRYIHLLDQTTEHRFMALQNIWQRVFETSLEGIAVTDREGVIEQVNESFTKITGYDANEAIGQHTRLLRSTKHETDFFETMWNDLLEQGHWEGEIWNRRKNGEVYLEWLSISAFRDGPGGETKYMAIFHDISDIRKKEEELQHVIHHDNLTNLPNRSRFYELVNQELESRKYRSLVILVLDVDNFSMVYNFLGSAQGDRYLQLLAALLEEVAGVDHQLARLAQSEFALLIRNPQNKLSIEQMLRKIQRRLDRTITLAGQKLNPLVNIGISQFPEQGNSADQLISRAQMAMQWARNQKRGSYQFFMDVMEQSQLDRLESLQALKTALRNREFLVEYQPKSRFTDDSLVGFEALMRWDRPEKGRIPPSQFIPYLEESGLIIEVGLWLIDEVCRFIKDLRRRTSKVFQIGINISTIQFAAPDFLENLSYICEKHQVPTSYVELEITENIAALELEGVVETLQRLSDQGFRISLDDFGTGYSSLAYLQELPFDSIKIDRAFISSLEEKEQSLAIVRSIVALAKTLKKETVAEGVETEEQKKLCKSEGCQIMQGYLLSKSLPFKEAIGFFLNPSWLEKSSPEPVKLKLSTDEA